MYIAAPEHSDSEIDTWISRQAHNTFGFYILNIVKKHNSLRKKIAYIPYFYFFCN